MRGSLSPFPPLESVGREENLVEIHYVGKLLLWWVYYASLTLATDAWRTAMARRTARPAAPHEYRLEPYQRRCVQCGGPAHIAYHGRRTIMTLDGMRQKWDEGRCRRVPRAA